MGYRVDDAMPVAEGRLSVDVADRIGDSPKVVYLEIGERRKRVPEFVGSPVVAEGEGVG